MPLLTAFRCPAPSVSVSHHSCVLIRFQGHPVRYDCEGEEASEEDVIHAAIAAHKGGSIP